MTPPRIRNGAVWRWYTYLDEQGRDIWRWRSDRGEWGLWYGFGPDYVDEVWALDCRSAEVDGARRQG